MIWFHWNYCNQIVVVALGTGKAMGVSRTKYTGTFAGFVGLVTHPSLVISGFDKQQNQQSRWPGARAVKTVGTLKRYMASCSTSCPNGHGQQHEFGRPTLPIIAIVDYAVTAWIKWYQFTKYSKLRVSNSFNLFSWYHVVSLPTNSSKE